MDSEDVLYIAAIALVGVGAGLYSVPAGLICAGLMMGFPPAVSLLARNRKGPQK